MRHVVRWVTLVISGAGLAFGGGEAVQPQLGVWYTVWWTRDDACHHWSDCHVLPLQGVYGAGEAAVIADHYAKLRDLGVDFIIMDDTNGCGADGGRIVANLRAWFDFMDAKPEGERIPICIGGGAEMRALGKAGQQQAAVYCQAEPTYLIILGQPEEFATEFPPAAPGSPRRVGFGPVLYTLKTPSEQLVSQVTAQLDKAEKTGYPVLIHLDDWNYPSASTDPEVVEWTAFPAAGESHGPLVRRRWINWGSWFITEAPPNYESRGFRADVQQRVSAVARAIATRLERWRAEGRAELFAGLVVGWESGYYTVEDFQPGERPRAGAESFADDEIVRTGYAALTARGHSAASVREAARKEGKPEAQVLRELMAGVVHDYSAFLTAACRSAGVPSDRIYTHYTGVSALLPEAVPGPLKEDGRNLPLWAAVNPDSRPGITATVPWTDVGRAAAMLREAGRSDWGAVEVEFTEATRAEDAARAYLDVLSTNGARVICVYGWWDPPGSTFGVRGSGAVPAMKRWLAGGAGDAGPR